jgi:hypothetical protein
VDSKAIYLSKTFWVNIIAMAAMVIQTQTGFVIDAEAQAAIWGFANIIIRFFTEAKVTIK